MNAIPQTAYSGAQVFYNKKLDKNKQIASTLQEILNKELKNDRVPMRIPEDTYMYRKLEPPGILIECGFLSNTDERNKLQTTEYQRSVAIAIAKGIEAAI